MEAFTTPQRGKSQLLEIYLDPSEIRSLGDLDAGSAMVLAVDVAGSPVKIALRRRDTVPPK